jgi:hypothetical protein
MNINNTYWQVVETKDDLEKLKELARTNTIQQIADMYGMSYAKTATVLRVNDIRAKRPDRPKKSKQPKKDHELTAWASYQNHGKIRNVYYNMLKRCYDETNKSYVYYGGRGIRVCNKWLEDCCNFYRWARDNGYNETLQLDRIDTNGNYEPDNCRWVTAQENNYNKRNTRKVTYNNETHTLIEWESITGIPRTVLADRIYKYKWSIERALT